MAPVYRPTKEESEQIEFLRESLAVLRQMLEQNPLPDTFLGRKTQEPFPTESGRRRAEDLVTPKRSRLRNRLMNERSK
jgi:hypothetical protein